MHGNVWEFIQDWYSRDYYYNTTGADPQGPPTGANHSLRGGDFNDIDHLTRSARRGGWRPPTFSNSDRGFRLLKRR